MNGKERESNSILFKKAKLRTRFRAILLTDPIIKLAVTSLFTFCFISIRLYVEKASCEIQIDSKHFKSLYNLVIGDSFSFLAVKIGGTIGC